MEDDIAAAMEQMLRGGGGPDLEAFVSRCPESMMPFSREGMAAASEEETVRFEAHALDDASDAAARVAATLEALGGRHAWHDAAGPAGGLAAARAGAVRVADSDEEWLLVALLFEASAGVAVRVTDGDGEFLLIDAADELPEWLEPESAAGRTWIVDGAVHVVLDAPGGPLAVGDALALLRDPAARRAARDNGAAREASAAAARRLRFDHAGPAPPGCAEHPAVAALRMNARVVLPARAAAALRRAPRLAAVAAAALERHAREKRAAGSRADDARNALSKQKRDDDAARRRLDARDGAVRAAARFGGPPEAAVVRFSKRAYAALLATPHAPPRALGRWTGGSLGPKLAAGLELLAGDADLDAAAAALLEAAAAAGPGPPPEADVDDDAWLTLDADAVEDRCRAANPSALDDVVDGFDQYVYDDEGDEAPPSAPVDLDEGAVLDLLAGRRSDALGADGRRPDVSEDLGADSDDEVDDAAGAAEAEAAPKEEGDDDADDAYGAALEAELAATEMAESFDRAPGDEEDSRDPLAPVDVDFNLVKNLLDSVGAQHGSPGAAALMLSELGVDLT